MRRSGVDRVYEALQTLEGSLADGPTGNDVDSVGAEPTSKADVRKSAPKGVWRHVRKEESHGLISNDTFTLVDKFPGVRKATKQRWVLDVIFTSTMRYVDPSHA